MEFNFLITFVFSLTLAYLKECANSIKLGKNLCKDLRNCQIYFPCKYFSNNEKLDLSLIKECPNNYVFSEEKQSCVKATNLEDFECLLLSSYLEEINNKTKIEQSKIKPNLLINSNVKRNENNFSPSKRLENINLGKKIIKKSSERDTNTNVEDVEEEYEEYDNDYQVSDNITKEYKRMCVVTNWSQFRPGRGRFHIDFIDQNLCNYIIYASVRVAEEELDDSNPDYDDSEQYTIKSVQHNDNQLYSKLQLIKSKNPSLKLILRITDDNGILYSKLSKSFDTRLNFVNNVIEYIEEIKFDGIEIEWRWPNGPSGSPSDKENFVELLKDFRFKMGTKYIIGMIMSPLTDRIQSSYSLLDINRDLDYVNVETFDYYGPWDKKTGLMSPLGKMNEQILFDASLNIEGTIGYLKALGLLPEKIIVGLAAYCRTYTLQHPLANQIGALTVGNGFSGSFTKTNGILSYYELCELRKKGNWKENWHSTGMVPYIYKENEWISFENEESLSKKIEFIKENDLAGASVYSIDMDDFRGLFCNQGSYPFLKYSLGMLSSNRKKLTTVSTTTTKTLTTKKIIHEETKDFSKSKNTETKTTFAKNSNKVTKKSRLINKHEYTINKSIINANKKKESTENEIILEKKKIESVQEKTSTYFLITPPIVVSKKKLAKYQSKPKLQHNIEQRNKIETEDKISEQNNLEKQNDLPIDNKLIKTLIDSSLIQFSEKQNINLANKFEEYPTIEQSPYEYVINPTKSKKLKALSNVNSNLKNNEPNEIYLDTNKPTTTLSSTVKYQFSNIWSQIINQESTTVKLAFNQVQIINKCENKKDGLYREENDCGSFYVCETSSIRIHTFKCPEGLIFNMKDCTCSWASNETPCIKPLADSFCKPIEKKNFFAETTIAQNTFHTIAQAWYGFNCEKREQGIYRDPNICTKFYYCQTLTDGGSLKHDFNCPPGLHFNMKECTCDWPTVDSCQKLSNVLNPCVRYK